uniref:MHYT domain-containing protein n=1 Tax=Steinernema glaseri TaxID=37863 RepID=A0A1I8AGH7_9BILA
GDEEDYYFDDNATYELYFRPYFTIVLGSAIAALSALSLLFHLRRCSKAARLGMLSALLVTYLASALLNVACELVKVVCGRTSTRIELKAFDKLQAFLMVSPELGFVAVSATSFLVAADRVAVM